MRADILLLLATACGGPSGAFHCQSDDECSLAGQRGACQLDGWCSFVDASCASGWRYGEFAGNGAARQCVPTQAEWPDAAVDAEEADAGVSPGLDAAIDIDIDAGEPDCEGVSCCAARAVFADVLAQHTCAIAADGQAWCWGYDEYGQVGNGGFGGNRGEPAATGLTGVEHIAVGGWHTCALAGDDVHCWGDNDFGQLSLQDGDRDRPEATELDGIVQLDGGDRSVCAVTAAGEVTCWGRNHKGQLGDGGLEDRRKPKLVAGLGGVTQVSVGATLACARKQDGTAWCWGAGDEGQLGDGLAMDSRKPVQVLLANVEQVEAGDDQACARLVGGQVSCWGDNEYGSLGDGTTTPRTTPVAVDGVDDAIELHVSDEWACARRASGTVACWGRNVSGQLGRGSSSDHESTPADVNGLVGVTGLALGANHACATTASGQVLCWGEGGMGQLGDGLSTSHLSPTAAAFGCASP